MMGGTLARRPALDLELRKLARSPVTRVATVAVLILTVVTTVGGYAAAASAPASDMARKAAAMVPTQDWAGFTGLAATSVGITMLLAAGIVMAWTAGREFTDGTIVGLFAVPPRLTSIAAAKVAATLAWVMLLSVVTAALLSIGGITLGLGASGVVRSAATTASVAVLLGVSALPVMWVATRLRGYLGGIAAALLIVIVTNVTAGFGLGSYLPWAIPVLWAIPGTRVPTPLLTLPLTVGLLGWWAVLRAWRGLQLGAA